MKYKSVFISDVHLGAHDIYANELCEFLKESTCDNLFLVGDIIDGWKLRRRWYWPQEHTNVIRKILTKAKRGTNVYYITGNHDEHLRKYSNFEMQLGNIHMLDHYEYEGIDSKKYLIIHGDVFDSLMLNGRWLMHFGDRVDDVVVWINLRLNTIRKWLRFKPWSLSKWLKEHATSAEAFTQRYREQAAQHCVDHGFDGIVCGHIHRPEIQTIDSISYLNAGDWYDHATAIVEHWNGAWELITYGEGAE